MKRLGQSRKYVLMCIDAKSSITQQYTVYYYLFIVLLFIIHSIIYYYSIIYNIMYSIIYFGRVTFFLSLEEFSRFASLRRMGRFAWQKIQPLRFKHHEICRTPCNGATSNLWEEYIYVRDERTPEPSLWNFGKVP